MATATAMTECEIMRLEKAAIIRVLHEEPAFSEMFVSHLLVRASRVEADLVDQLFNSSEKVSVRPTAPSTRLSRMRSCAR
jgi:CRP/FNR family transcriptional regulator, cyclic AMP receptor protein